MRKKTTPTLSLEEREALFDELEASLSPRPLLTVREQVGEPERPLYEYESDRTHKTPEEIDQEIEQMCAELLADCGKSPVSEHSQKKRCSNPYDEQPSSGKNADEPSELLQKPVNFGTPKHASPLVTTVLSKQFAMSETSILGKNPSNTLHTDQKPHTLLEGVQPKMFVFRSWRDTDDNHKLMLAVAPLLDRAAEADSDLMFTTPGSDIEREGFASALGWAAYCAKNKLSVRADSRLNEFYDLPAGKATYISSELLRRTKAHYQRTILIHANRNARKGT